MMSVLSRSYLECVANLERVAKTPVPKRHPLIRGVPHAFDLEMAQLEPSYPLVGHRPMPKVAQQYSKNILAADRLAVSDVNYNSIPGLTKI
jgi:hypothetical protein